MVQRLSTDFGEYIVKRINVTTDNLESEHICCAISDKRMAHGVLQKKAWLQQRMGEGLVFKKLDVNGKVCIEYFPAEYAPLQLQDICV